MKKRHRRLGLAAVLAGIVTLVLVVSACGGDDDEAAPAPTEPAPAAAAPEPEPPAPAPAPEPEPPAPAPEPPAPAPEPEPPAPAPAEPEVTVAKVAVVAPEKANDFGWNQQGVEGATAAATAMGAEIEVADEAGFEDITPVLRQLADEDVDFIVAHASAYNTVAPEVGAEFGIPVVTFDKPDNTTPGLVADIETSAFQGGYLAGVLAALTTQTGTLGIVESADDTNWHKQSGGFIDGARSINPDIEILLAQIAEFGYADTQGGKRVTDSVIAGGADIVFGMGDGSSFGMLQSVETSDPPPGADQVWFIDVIGDKQGIDEQGVLLSSVLWDFEGTYTQAIADINAGTFGEQGYDLNVENGGIALLRTQFIPDEVWDQVQAAR
ncbi:MAG: BMP family ABC transporter substrate-binding protein, partial [Gaiellales bacterium]